jgi:hypothetical protein
MSPMIKSSRWILLVCSSAVVLAAGCKKPRHSSAPVAPEPAPAAPIAQNGPGAPATPAPSAAEPAPPAADQQEQPIVAVATDEEAEGASPDAGAPLGAGDAGPPAQGLEAETVRRTVTQHMAEVQQCMEAARDGGVTPAGKLQVAFTIDRKGRVKRAKLEKSTMNDPAAATCVVEVVKGIRFPQAERPTRVLFPFSFVR